MARSRSNPRAWALIALGVGVLLVASSVPTTGELGRSLRIAGVLLLTGLVIALAAAGVDRVQRLRPGASATPSEWAGRWDAY